MMIIHLGVCSANSSLSKEFIMKNVLKLFGIIALVTVIIFSMTACKDDGWLEGKIYFQSGNGSAKGARYNAAEDKIEFLVSNLLLIPDYGDFHCWLIGGNFRTHKKGVITNIGWYDIKGLKNALEFLNLLASIISAIMAAAINTLTPFILVSISICAVNGAACNSAFFRVLQHQLHRVPAGLATG
jgi:hypothetical protein